MCLTVGVSLVAGCGINNVATESLERGIFAGVRVEIQIIE
jgi:hypothetical protein